MTTEIAIMNKHAVALAADSAVTSGEKIFQSANKIFSLSKYHPVGIMVYSAASYCGIPWETIIKKYRKNIADNCFDTLGEYASDFLSYLKNDESIERYKINQNVIIREFSRDFAGKIQRNITKHVEMVSFERNGEMSEDLFKEIVKVVFESNFLTINDADKISSRDEIAEVDFYTEFNDEIRNIYTSMRIDSYRDIVENLYLKFRRAIYLLSTNNIFPCGYSGIVITGFGEKELCPTTVSYRLGFSILNSLQISKEDSLVVEDDNESCVVAFAQDDVIKMFMDGIHPEACKRMIETYKTVLNDYAELIIDTFGISKRRVTAAEETLKKINETIIEKMISTLNYSKAKFSMPTIETISIMQPIELAKLADSLVSITSMHRQVSQFRETVGGPTDVALISKGDGFIWIKRKHYFEAQLNPHFFKR